MRRLSSSLPRWASILLGLVVLHCWTSLPFPWEEGRWSQHLLTVSPDLALCLGLGWLCGLLWGWRSWWGHPVTLCFMFVPMYRVGWSVVPAFWGKDLDLYNDALLLPGLQHILTKDLSETQVVLAYVGCGLAALAVHAFLFLVVRAVTRIERRRGAVAGLLSIQLVVLASWAEGTPARKPHGRVMGVGMWSDAMAQSGDALRTRLWRFRSEWRGRLSRADVRIAETPGNVDRLKHVDVHLMFIESYGRIALQLPGDDLQWLRDLDQESEAAGLHARSGYARPSVMGGGSSLAHAELMSGVQVESRRYWDLMLKSFLKPLPKYFQDAGHVTFSVHPIMQESWPEGNRFYGFDHEVIAEDFEYQGLKYHWGIMPDQYALAKILRDVLQVTNHPVFMQYVSVTTHSPYSLLPPWIEDWSAAAEPDAFAREPARMFDISWLNFREHPDVLEAYKLSVDYGLRCMVRFAAELSRPSLVIVVGDHQPPHMGLRSPQGQDPKDVPIHMIANRKDILDRLDGWELNPGMVPSPDGSSFPFSRFLERFLKAYGR